MCWLVTLMLLQWRACPPRCGAPWARCPGSSTSPSPPCPPSGSPPPHPPPPPPPRPRPPAATPRRRRTSASPSCGPNVIDWPREELQTFLRWIIFRDRVSLHPPHSKSWILENEGNICDGQIDKRVQSSGYSFTASLAAANNKRIHWKAWARKTLPQTHIKTWSIYSSGKFQQFWLFDL